MSVEWEPIDRGTYAAIWACIGDNDMTVFGTHTCMDGCSFHDKRHFLTEWGFKNSPAPLIRSIDNDGEWTYWIARVTK